MKKLSVQLAHLRERFEGHAMCVPEMAIIDYLEKKEWKNKTPGGKKVLDIHLLGLDFGAEFAFAALKLAEPKALANQIARYICIDVALTGLDLHPDLERDFPRSTLESLREFIGKNADLSAWEDWAAELQEGYRLSHCEVRDRMYTLFGAPLHGYDINSDWAVGGLNGLGTAIDDLEFLLVRADERYLAAQRIAELAKRLEAQWQNGTRLEFEFIGDIEQAMEDLEEKLTPAHRQRALGRMWSSWVFHTTGEVIRPVAPSSLVDLTKATAS